MSMTSHELANRLLELEDRPVTIVVAVDGPYTQEKSLHPGGPWEDLGGHIRIQLEDKGVAMEVPDGSH